MAKGSGVATLRSQLTAAESPQLQSAEIARLGVVIAIIYELRDEAMRRKRIFLNPGHALGVDPGACGHGLQEAAIAAAVADDLLDYLKTAGWEVASLQSDNLCGDAPGLPCVVEDANAFGGICISLHCNAAQSDAARGTETLIYSMDEDDPESGAYADKLHAAFMLQLLQLDPDCEDRGIKCRPDLAVLRETDGPALLVELGFITSPEDCRILRQTSRLAAMLLYAIFSAEGCISDPTPDERAAMRKAWGSYMIKDNLI